jgi:hypothetical protein
MLIDIQKQHYIIIMYSFEQNTYYIQEYIPF